MKRMLMIGILWVFTMTACTLSVKSIEPIEPVETSSQTLSAIDNLMWQQPDSAFILLQEFAASPKADSLDAFGGHYFQLLLSELLYKNDYAQTNRTELRQAVAYFDSLVREAPPLKRGLGDVPPFKGVHERAGDSKHKPTRNDQLVFLSARAHYINGVGYYERDSAVEACKEYYKALEVMEDHFGEKELVEKKVRFVALTYTRLSMLFSDMYLHEQAIFFAQRSLTYYKQLNMPIWYIARMLNEIGSQYDMMKNSDSAACYYQKAINILDDTTSLIYRDIAVHLILMEYKKSACQTSSIIKRLRQLLMCSESQKESQVRYMNIGEIFYYEQRYDSAWVYLNKVFQTTTIVGLKRQAAEWLMKIGKMKDMEIHAYTDFLAPFANQEENKSEIKSQLTELYKAFRQAQLERQHQEEMRQHSNRSIRIIAGWSMVTLIIIALFCYYNKQHKQHYKSQMEAEHQAHKMQQAALAGRLKRSNVALKEQQKHNTKASAFNPQPPKADKYEDEPICRHILGLCKDKRKTVKTTVAVNAYSDIALSDAQKAELKKAALAHYAPLFEALKRQYPKLKEKDFFYCYLCLLGLDNAQIAVLTQLSYRTIWEREKRLQCIFHKEGSISIILNEMITD